VLRHDKVLRVTVTSDHDKVRHSQTQRNFGRPASVTKLSYGYDDVDCVLCIMYVFVVMYRMGGGAVDTPIVDPAPPPVLLTFSS
jgi:hypothetical protein